MAYNAEKKNLTPWYVRKNSFIRGLGKKILPKPNYPYPPSKVKWSAPNSRVRWPISCRICDNMLVSFYQNTDTSVTRTLDSRDFDVCPRDNLLY